ncbi:sulfite exporter TauE/SafE family protein [Myxococcota bacterium]|nr:sulfite exporter TauE/SafE family protein [Myxococcota bacterium]
MFSEIPWWMHVLLVASGFVAGFVNTVAGAGSALTLPALMFSGVDAAVANATNRVAVVVQTIGGTTAFHRRGVRPWRDCLSVVPALAAGGLAGAWAALRVSPGGLQVVFGGLFVVLAVLLLAKPRWLVPPNPGPGETHPHARSPAAQLLFFATGVYGGFVQAGVGIPLLLLLVRFVGLDVVAGNAGKTVLTAVFTLVALLVFQGAGAIDWVRGAEVAVGSLLGSLVGVEAAIRLGVELIRRAVVVGLLLAAGRMLGVY